MRAWSERIRGLFPVPRRALDAEREARRAAEAAGAQLALFADATRVLTSSFDLDVMLNDLTGLVTARFADACMVDLVEPDDSLRRAAAAVAVGHAELPARLVAVRVRNPKDVAEEALRTRRPQVAEEDGWTAVVVPLKGRQGTLGVLRVVQQPGRDQVSSTIQLAEELARRASIAVENARLFARQRTVSETLQQSLLPDRLPDIPGLATAARYLSGGPDVDIGGDWYDVMQLPGGAIGLALGDVVGRGERAASLMGQLRNAVRAYAFDGRRPHEVIDRVNALLLDAGSEHMATMIYGVLDTEIGEFRFVNAGHPPPLLLQPHRAPEFLEGRSGPLVGALPTSLYPELTAVLEPGSTLLLYTDGLVEDRETPVEQGLARLRDAARDRPEDLEAFCSQLMRRIIGTRACDDDVALLTVQLLELGPELHLEVPGRPGALAPLRATLRRWLKRVGASDAETFELLTACGEACTNAIRHASGPLAAEFTVDARAVDGTVEIRVRDQGRWREPRGDVGGRGLPIIEAYVDRLDINPSPSGTEVVLHRRLAVDGELIR